MCDYVKTDYTFNYGEYSCMECILFDLNKYQCGDSFICTLQYNHFNCKHMYLPNSPPTCTPTPIPLPTPIPMCTPIPTKAEMARNDGAIYNICIVVVAIFISDAITLLLSPLVGFIAHMIY
jgi:hypothetical protein